MGEKSYFNRVVRRIKESWDNLKYENIAKQLKVDPSIIYPSYKSMDQFIDIEHLASLDKYITDYLEKYLLDNKIARYNFPTGTSTLQFWKPKITQSYYIPITYSPDKYNYWNLNDASKFRLSSFAYELPELMTFIRTLPFKETARIMLMFDTGGHVVTPHRDHINLNVCHEFIWFRTNFKKKFYVYSKGEKEYIEGYSAWFDTVNQFHGADAANELNFSLRVDGIFSDELRAKIPLPPYNLASTPAYWAWREQI